MNREVLGRMLELLGCEADMTADGAEALARWRQGGHRIALIDLHMPVLDGLDLARAIRREEAATGLPAHSPGRRDGQRAEGRGRALPGRRHGRLRCQATGAGDPAGHLGPVAGADGCRAGGASSGARPLFDPAVLQGLFGQDAARLEGLLERFAASAAEDAAAIARAVAAGDPAAATAVAHRLKGACRMAGAERLAGQAESIEQAVRAGDAPGTAQAAAALPRLLAATLAAIRGA